MFPLKDEKELFRIGAKVTHDMHPNVVFKVTKKRWEGNGTLNYFLESMDPDGPILIGARQKHMNKF